jgi:hypothetical protein
LEPSLRDELRLRDAEHSTIGGECKICYTGRKPI